MDKASKLELDRWALRALVRPRLPQGARITSVDAGRMTVHAVMPAEPQMINCTITFADKDAEE